MPPPAGPTPARTGDRAKSAATTARPHPPTSEDGTFQPREPSTPSGARDCTDSAATAARARPTTPADSTSNPTHTPTHPGARGTARATTTNPHPPYDGPTPHRGPHPNPQAADEAHPPQENPAPDNATRTGGAGGKHQADGEAKARRPITGMLLGLATGDATGWPSARHRATRMPDWTRRLTRELDTFAEQNATTTLPVPIALNQPPAPLHLGPSDDAEWAALTAQTLLRTTDPTTLNDLSRDHRTRTAIDLTWTSLAAEVAAATTRAPEIESAVLPLRARISVRAGLTNLAAGLRPPATGHDNPHYFDDAACVRACVLATTHPGNPERAADLAEFDARYTQDGDGVHGARAMAAAISLALTGESIETCVQAALTQLPPETEIGRNARHALHLAESTDSTFALIPLLEHQIVDHVYSYGIAAAETVPVTLAISLAANGRIAEAIPAATCLSRVADSTPALTGALTGAIGGAAAIPDTWRTTSRTLSGCTLPRLTGTDLLELAELLEAAQPPTTGA
ncbi:ADP-ribosylglycohydrolase family protein [Streptomyces niveiscabiei]|uniref:ADP-ribosylglycohydrolase family protein n=1 Tax=Streptomyces niveiscabiei TaxID=164115 RepID=A0ABW9HVF8_9ACTN